MHAIIIDRSSIHVKNKLIETLNELMVWTQLEKCGRGVGGIRSSNIKGVIAYPKSLFTL
jgi:hypothetical protein